MISHNRCKVCDYPWSEHIYNFLGEPVCPIPEGKPQNPIEQAEETRQQELLRRIERIEKKLGLDKL